MKRAPGHRRGSRPKGSRVKDQGQEVGHLDIFIVCEPISTDARLLPRPGIDKGYPDAALRLPWRGAASSGTGSLYERRRGGGAPGEGGLRAGEREGRAGREKNKDKIIFYYIV